MTKIEEVEEAIKQAEDSWQAQIMMAEEGAAEYPEDSQHERMARAAIEAMREPTEEMVDVGMKYFNTESRTNLEMALDAMTDEVLKNDAILTEQNPD